MTLPTLMSVNICLMTESAPAHQPGHWRHDLPCTVTNRFAVLQFCVFWFLLGSNAMQKNANDSTACVFTPRSFVALT